MEVLKFERTISRIQSPNSLEFEGKTYLWVIHADKIPPHLGISSNALFYSLKANGKDEALRVPNILQVLERKNIAVVFYQIDNSAVSEDLKVVFNRFERTIPEQVTCLEPLKQLLNSPHATWIKELLRDLEGRKLLQNAFGWQLPEGFQQILDYNPEDIHKRLNQLKDV